MKKDYNDYRSVIYERYATNFQDLSDVFDIAAAHRWGRGYKYYFRNWLPANSQASIVDVACGGGKLLHFFKELSFVNVSGVDISPEQVAISRQVFPTVYQANILEWLDAHPSEFDLITGLDIVEHLEKPEVLRLLDVCYDALKPGGRLILQTSNAESPWGSMHRYNDFTHEVGFTPKLLSRLFRLSGFQNIESREPGPVPLGYSFFSSIRYLIWQAIRVFLMIWNLAETGTIGSGVFTRVFLISGVKGS